MIRYCKPASRAARPTCMPVRWPRRPCPLRPCARASSARSAAHPSLRRSARRRARRLARHGRPPGPLVAALGGISAGRTVTDVGISQKAGGPRSSDPARRSIPIAIRCWASISSAAAARRPGRARGQTDFPSISAYDQAEVLRRVARASAHRRLARDRRRVVRRHGRAGIRRALSAARCSTSLPSAQRIAHIRWRRRGAACSARSFVMRSKNGDGAGRAAARARPGDGDLSQPAGIRARFSGAAARDRRALPVPGGDVSAGARRCLRSHVRSRSFVCLSESIDLHQVDADAHPRAGDTGRGP